MPGMLLRDETGPDQLVRAEPGDWTVAPGWQGVVDAFFQSEKASRCFNFSMNALRLAPPYFRLSPCVPCC